MADNRSGSNKKTERRSASKRERLDNPRSGSMYVRRDDEGKFKEVESPGRAASADQRRDAEKESRPGFGDRGDRDSGGESRGGSRSHSGRDDED